MAYSMYRTASGGRMNAPRADDRDLVTGLPLRSGGGLMGGQNIPVASASRTGGPRNSAADYLHSLLGQVDSGSRGAIDEAAVGAKSAADTAYGAMIRNLSRMGVNPQSPRFAATMGDWAANRAAMEAAARNQASRDASRDSFGRRFSLYGAMQGSEEADRNRQFQREMAGEGRNFANFQAERGRRWGLQDRDSEATARQAENEQYLRMLSDFQAGQSKPAPSASTPALMPPARKPGLQIKAHTPANFPATNNYISDYQTNRPYRTSRPSLAYA